MPIQPLTTNAGQDTARVINLTWANVAGPKVIHERSLPNKPDLALPAQDRDTERPPLAVVAANHPLRLPLQGWPARA